MESIEDKIKRFEIQFNNEKISEIDIESVVETDDYYVVNLTIYYESGDVDQITECEYPKKLINIFE